MPEDGTVAEFRSRDAGTPDLNQADLNQAGMNQAGVNQAGVNQADLNQTGLNEIAGAFLGLTMSHDTGAEANGPEAAYLASAARRVGSAAAACANLIAALANPVARDRPIVRVATALRLGLAETAALAIARMVETDALAGRAVSYLHSPLGGARPTLGLLAAALAPLDPEPGLAARLAAGAAVRYRPAHPAAPGR